MRIDTHVHLWQKQNGTHNGRPVFALTGGKSNFGGRVHQMMPPYMLTGENTAEMLLANMDYAGVNGAVCVQEVMDGNQDAYLLSARAKYPERLRVCALYQEGQPFALDGFDGIKLCACKFKEPDLLKHIDVFQAANDSGKFVAIDLADGDSQTHRLQEIIDTFPDLRIAIGHFGMVTRPGWLAQIKLARNKNVFIESGGITWLFNDEFYPYPSAIAAIRQAAEICGYDKLMWGSDYPRTMVEITYKMSFDFILKSPEISDTDKDKFLYRNAKAFYRFPDFQEILPPPNML